MYIYVFPPTPTLPPSESSCCSGCLKCVYCSSLSPNMANTVNAALKPLETLSRIVNQPSSLFGGKGGSSKSKTEHDTVGTVRDSNSNTQDQGINVILIWSVITQLFCLHLLLMCGIWSRRVWRNRTSGWQSQGPGTRQWSHGWRSRGRHSGYCRSAGGSKHASYAGERLMHHTILLNGLFLTSWFKTRKVIISKNGCKV